MPSFNGWTRKLILLPLCLMFSLGWVMSMPVVLSWMAESWRSMLYNVSLHSITAVLEPFVCLFLVLPVALLWQKSSAFSAVSSFVYTICFVFNGDIAIKIAGTILYLPLTSSNPRALTHPDITFLLIGTLIKCLSWLLFVVLTTFLTYTYESKETRTHPNATTYVAHRVTRRMMAPLIYISVISWTVFISRMDPNFAVPNYILYPYLAALMLAGLLGDDTVLEGYIALNLMFVLTIDLSETIYHCSTFWSQPCIKPSPLYLNTMISSSIVCTFHWIRILVLWLFSHKQSSGEKHCPAKAVTTAAAAEEIQVTGEQPLACSTSQHQEQQCNETTCKPSTENAVYLV